MNNFNVQTKGVAIGIPGLHPIEMSPSIATN